MKKQMLKLSCRGLVYFEFKHKEQGASAKNHYQRQRLTKNSSIVGKRYIGMFNFDEGFWCCDETILFPCSCTPDQVSFLEVGVPRIQNSSYSKPGYRLHSIIKKSY